VLCAPMQRAMLCLGFNRLHTAIGNNLFGNRIFKKSAKIQRIITKTIEMDKSLRYNGLTFYAKFISAILIHPLFS
jgi:hypothetical protein